MLNEMTLTISIAVFPLLIGITLGNVFVINRNRLLRNQKVFSWDSFTIPLSICNRSISAGNECEPFHAINGDRSCFCYCPPDRASFVFEDNEWTCLNNTMVRDLQDCSYTSFFFRERHRGWLWALKEGDRIFTDIQAGQSGWQSCEVHLNSSWYLGCNGLRRVSSLHLMKELFTFNVRFGSIMNFFLTVESGVQNASLLQGRIINLGFRCNKPNGNRLNGCLMFKLMGKLTCSVPQPDLQTSPTPKAQDSTLTGTPTRTAITTPLSSMVTLSIITLSTKSAFPSNAQHRPSSGLERRTDNASPPLDLIAGVTVSIIALLVVIIVGFLFYRRRCHSKKKSDTVPTSSKGKNSKDTVMMSPYSTSPIHCTDENGYKAINIRTREPEIYASNYSVPHHPDAAEGDPDSGHVYAPLRIPNGHNIYGHNAHEPVYNVPELPTSHTQTSSQNGSTSFEQPVYNVLEELSNAEEPQGIVNHGTEPVYNVLEEHEGTGFSSEGPIYNTLEEHYTDQPYETGTNEPVYNVLEESTYPST